MKTTEQLSAMEMMAVDPLARIVAPRFWGGVISMPLLAALFSVMGVFGAYLVGVRLIGVDNGTFWGNMQAGIDFWPDVINGIIKSIVFGIAVSLIAVFEGYDAKPTAEGVSAATTRTVVGGVARDPRARLRSHRIHVPGHRRSLKLLPANLGLIRDEKHNHRPVGRHLRHDRHRCDRIFLALKVGNLTTLETGAELSPRGELRQHRRSQAARAGQGRRRGRRPRRVGPARPQDVRGRRHAARSTTATSSRKDTIASILTSGPPRRGVHRPRSRRRHRRCSPTAAVSPRRSRRWSSRS